MVSMSQKFYKIASESRLDRIPNIQFPRKKVLIRSRKKQIKSRYQCGNNAVGKKFNTECSSSK